MDLNADFAAFIKTEQAKKAPDDQGDWRSRNAANANSNGDAHADATPDTSVGGGYVEPDDEDDDELGL
jgi:hypothetical protein